MEYMKKCVKTNKSNKSEKKICLDMSMCKWCRKTKYKDRMYKENVCNSCATYLRSSLSELY